MSIFPPMKALHSPSEGGLEAKRGGGSQGAPHPASPTAVRSRDADGARDRPVDALAGGKATKCLPQLSQPAVPGPGDETGDKGRATGKPRLHIAGNRAQTKADKHVHRRILSRSVSAPARTSYWSHQERSGRCLWRPKCCSEVLENRLLHAFAGAVVVGLAKWQAPIRSTTAI